MDNFRGRNITESIQKRSCPLRLWFCAMFFILFLFLMLLKLSIMTQNISLKEIVQTFIVICVARWPAPTSVSVGSAFYNASLFLPILIFADL